MRLAIPVLLLTPLVPMPWVEAADGQSSEQIAAEIARVQGQADETAADWAETQLEAEALSEQVARVQAELEATGVEHQALRAAMSRVAVNQYVNAGSDALPIFASADPSESLQRRTLAGVALDSGATDANRLEEVEADLSRQQRELQRLRDKSAQVAVRLEQRLQATQAKLVQLQALKDKVQDEETKRAYQARIAEQRAAADAERIRAEETATAARVSAAAPRGAGTVAPPTTIPAPAPRPPAPSPVGTTATTPTTQPRAPEPTIPKPRPPAVVVGGDWICPVAGPAAFGDTWGAARSGGRHHEGVDMMSPQGTPVVAVVAGSALMKTNRLGGNVVSLTGVDGNRYYYAHLSAWEGGSRSVTAGEVIGYVGHTGNTSADHLHFGMYPGGGAAVNPYPTVRRYC